MIFDFLLKERSDNLKSQSVINEIDELSRVLVNIENKENLNQVLSSFSDIINKAGLDHVRNIKVDSNYKKGKFWFDEDCHNERIKFLKRKQLFDLDDTDDNRKEMCKQRSVYRKVCRKKRKSYNMSQAENLLTLSKKKS